MSVTLIEFQSLLFSSVDAMLTRSMLWHMTWHHFLGRQQWLSVRRSNDNKQHKGIRSSTISNPKKHPNKGVVSAQWLHVIGTGWTITNFDFPGNKNVTRPFRKNRLLPGFRGSYCRDVLQGKKINQMVCLLYLPIESRTEPITKRSYWKRSAEKECVEWSIS